MIWTIPTMITLLRIALIPVFVVAFYLPDFSWKHILTTSLFFVAGISDMIDGYLARKLNQQSRFGAFLDPVADKLIVAIALVMLVQYYNSIWLSLASMVIIGREIAISALREWMAEVGDKTKVSVSIIGKIKTSAQMLAIGMLLFQKPLWIFPIESMGYFLLYLAALLTLWSMVIYIRAALPSMAEK